MLLLAVPFALVACGPAPGTRAHDDSAAGHREQAASHQAEAETLAFANSKLYYQSAHRDHERLASAHLRAAQQLEAEHAAACEQHAQASMTPWPRVVSTDDVSGGVVLHLTHAVGSEDDILADLQCRRSSLALDGFDRHPDDPLAIESLDVVVHAEPGGTAVMFGVDGEAQVEELRRRVDVIAQAK